MKEFGRNAKEKMALTLADQNRLLDFVDNSKIYSKHLAMLKIMIGTACRVGEVTGLTWNDVDMKERTISINHQLTYKNFGGGTKFHIMPPKTEAGKRLIPMTKDVYRAFIEQQKIQLLLGINHNITIDELSGFIFTSKSGTPLQTGAVNNILYNIVKAFNKNEERCALKENRKMCLLPMISAHTLRHTGCTRMAEKGMDIKVLQYIMGHSNISVTMEVYNHITDKSRVNAEIKKLDDQIAI